MQSCQVRSLFETAPMNVQEGLPCANLSNNTGKQVSLAIQPLFATMSDDGVQGVCNSHAISQPDIACHSSCNLDEGKGSSTISSTTFSSHPRTVSTHGNHTQVENTLPQDLQDKMKEKLNAIIKTHQNIQNELLDYKEILAKHSLIRRPFNKINKYISSRAIRITRYITTPNYKDKFHFDKRNCQRAQLSIQEIMKNATALGLTQLNEPLIKMDACYKKMIMCMDKARLNHNQRQNKNSWNTSEER